MEKTRPQPDSNRYLDPCKDMVNRDPVDLAVVGSFRSYIRLLASLSLYRVAEATVVRNWKPKVPALDIQTGS